MTARGLALLLGILYVGLGVLGLMPGALAGLVAANPPLAIVHLAMGAWGLAAHFDRARPHSYAQGAALVFAVLALAGMLHGLDRFLGPPYVWLHLVTAAVAGFVAWRPSSGERRSIAGDRRRTRARVAVERRFAEHDRRSWVRG